MMRTFSEKSTRRPSCGDRLRMQYPATRPLQCAPCGRSIPIFQRAPGQWIAAAAGIAAQIIAPNPLRPRSVIQTRKTQKKMGIRYYFATKPKIYCGGALWLVVWL